MIMFLEQTNKYPRGHGHIILNNPTITNYQKNSIFCFYFQPYSTTGLFKGYT